MCGVQVFVFLLCIFYVNSVMVQTSLGELEGSQYVTNNGREIFTFFGVPYARPPVGKHRFEEPKLAKNWTGIWLAMEHSPVCIQYNTLLDIPDRIIGNEDCLYLDIYTPTVSQPSNLPVLVYFNGGVILYASKIYNQDVFLENHEIVHVSVNYRSGPFGFLSTQDNIVPGNNGLKDQVLALKWVQENIEAFGGDKNRVTIAGNSEGGVCVHFHYLSLLSQGLFERGISSSGSALLPWALTENPLEKAKMLADSIGCPINATDIMIKCLKQRPSRQILSKLHSLFTPWTFNLFSPFGPVVENSTRIPFLHDHPYTSLSRGEVYDGPWLTGVTTEEGLHPAATFTNQEELLQQLNDNWYKIAPYLLDFKNLVVSDKHNTISDQIRNFYFRSEAISITTQNTVIEMLNDRLFKANMGLAASLQATLSPVFVYIFGYGGKQSLTNKIIRSKSSFGGSNFEDTFYIMALPESSQLEVEADKEMTLAITNMWASFIETGVPSPEWDPVPPVSAVTGGLPHLLIQSPSQILISTSNDFGNYQFWNSLGFNENVVDMDVLLQTKDEL